MKIKIYIIKPQFCMITCATQKFEKAAILHHNLWVAKSALMSNCFWRCFMDTVGNKEYNLNIT